MRILRGGNITKAARNGATLRRYASEKGYTGSIKSTGNRAYSRILAHSQGRKKLSDNNISSNNNNDSKSSMYKDITSTAASNLKKCAQKLLVTGESSVFVQGKKTGSTKEIVKDVNNFIKNYNNMVSCMSNFNISENSSTLQFFSNCAEKESDALSAVGITVLKGGKLTVNPNILAKANIENLEKIFNGKSSFAEKILEKSAQVEEKNASTMNTAYQSKSSKRYLDFLV